MDRILTFIFLVIAIIAGIGGAFALGANVWINVDRKRRDLALLRLMGVADLSVVLVLVWQALVTATAAFALGYFCYQVGASVLNTQLAASLTTQQYACILHLTDLVLIFLIVLVIAAVSATVAGLRATMVDPAERLREAC